MRSCNIPVIIHKEQGILRNIV